jgi:hypothetical protein
MMLVMSARNECLEYQRLNRSYEDSIIVWEQDRNSNVRPINRARLTTEQAAKLRDQALFRRNAAANALYVHLRTCPVCNPAKK